MELFQILEVTEDSPTMKSSPLKPVIKLTAAESTVSDHKSLDPHFPAIMSNKYEKVNKKLDGLVQLAAAIID